MAKQMNASVGTGKQRPQSAFAAVAPANGLDGTEPPKADAKLAETTKPAEELRAPDTTPAPQETKPADEEPAKAVDAKLVEDAEAAREPAKADVTPVAPMVQGTTEAV